MPGGDRTGPMGMGPRSGRAAGYCAGFGMPGRMNPEAGRARGGGRGSAFGGRGGRGWGGGGGRGWRNWFYATGQPGWMRGGAGAFWATPEMEKDHLARQIGILQTELKAANERLAELEPGVESQS